MAPYYIFPKIEKGTHKYKFKNSYLSKSKSFSILKNIEISKFDHRFPQRPSLIIKKKCYNFKRKHARSFVPPFRSEITSFQDGSKQNETRKREKEILKKKKNTIAKFVPHIISYKDKTCNRGISIRMVPSPANRFAKITRG